MKNRIVVIGANGFVGNSIYCKLKAEKYDVVKIIKKDVNLLEKESIEQLKNTIKRNDIVIFVSAIAPCKNLNEYHENLVMVNNFIMANIEKRASQIINISSDAVYGDSFKKMDEDSLTYPDSIHGSMHLMRETLLRSFFNDILTIIRPTLIYGSKDPHNGYGPNKFIRLINNKEDIKLFGEGEELRDHVYIEDVSNLVLEVVKGRVFGVFNAVSGEVMSFKDIANQLKIYKSSEIKIKPTLRKGKIPHNGFRAFEKSRAESIFKNFKFTAINDGLKKL